MDRKRQAPKPVAFADSFEDAQNHFATIAQLALEIEVERNGRIEPFKINDRDWLNQLLDQAALAIVHLDHEEAIEALGKATVGVNGLIVKYLKGSPQHFEAKFDSARAHFLSEIDMIVANYPDWTPDRSFEQVQNYWNKRIAALKAAPCELQNDLAQWIKVHNGMRASLANVIQELKDLLQKRYSAANRAKQDANKVRLARRIAEREERDAEKAAAKIAAREIVNSNPEIQKDLKEVKDLLSGFLVKKQPSPAAAKSA